MRTYTAAVFVDEALADRLWGAGYHVSQYGTEAVVVLRSSEVKAVAEEYAFDGPVLSIADAKKKVLQKIGVDHATEQMADRFRDLVTIFSFSFFFVRCINSMMLFEPLRVEPVPVVLALVFICPVVRRQTTAVPITTPNIVKSPYEVKIPFG